MKATDLMIGNIIQVKEDKRIVVIEEIYPLGVGVKDIDGTKFQSLFEDFEYIFLTEEISEKLKVDKIKSLQKGSGTYWCTLVSPYAPVTYINELQNLFKALDRTLNVDALLIK